jgi:hypothetical protein
MDRLGVHQAMPASMKMDERPQEFIILSGKKSDPASSL